MTQPRHPQRREFIRSTSALALAGATGALGLSGCALTDAGGSGRRTLIRNGVVLTLDPKVGDFERADVLIEGDRIVAVGPKLEVTDAQVIDATRMIVMPGFIDTHHHCYQGQLRNVLSNGLLADYFRDIQGVTPKYRPRDAHIGAVLSALRAIDAGITMITDTSQVQHTPEHTDAAIQGLADTGIRSLFTYSPGVGPGVRYPQDLSRVAKQYFSTKDQLLTLGFNSIPDAKLWTAGREHAARLYSHIVRGIKPVAPERVDELARQGLVRSDQTFIHYTGSTAASMKMLADNGVTLSLAVPIEMAMRHGMPPIQLALDHKVRISLSTDVETTMAADMFTQMRSTHTVQRMFANERALNGDKDVPRLLTTKDVLSYATIDGAHANGIADRTGTLTPGKYADVILLRTDRPNVAVLNNAYGAVVTNMDVSNVDTVFVGGKMLKRGGELVGIDWQRITREAEASRDWLVAQQGWPRSVLDTSLPGH